MTSLYDSLPPKKIIKLYWFIQDTLPCLNDKLQNQAEHPCIKTMHPFGFLRHVRKNIPSRVFFGITYAEPDFAEASTWNDSFRKKGYALTQTHFAMHRRLWDICGIRADRQNSSFSPTLYKLRTNAPLYLASCLTDLICLEFGTDFARRHLTSYIQNNRLSLSLLHADKFAPARSFKTLYKEDLFLLHHLLERQLHALAKTTNTPYIEIDRTLDRLKQLTLLLDSKHLSLQSNSFLTENYAEYREQISEAVERFLIHARPQQQKESPLALIEQTYDTLLTNSVCLMREQLRQRHEAAAALLRSLYETLLSFRKSLTKTNHSLRYKLYAKHQKRIDAADNWGIPLFSACRIQKRFLNDIAHEKTEDIEQDLAAVLSWMDKLNK